MTRIGLVLFLGAVIAFVGCNCYMAAIRECSEQFKLTGRRVKAGEASEDVKCLSECILKKTGCMDDNGNFYDAMAHCKVQEELMSMARSDEQKAMFQKAVAKCKEQVKTENPTGKCEKGFTFLKCVRKATGGD